MEISLIRSKPWPSFNERSIFLQALVTINPPEYYPQFFFGILLIVFLIYRPKGLFPERPIKTVANKVVLEESQEPSTQSEKDQNQEQI